MLHRIVGQARRATRRLRIRIWTSNSSSSIAMPSVSPLSIAIVTGCTRAAGEAASSGLACCFGLATRKPLKSCCCFASCCCFFSCTSFLPSSFFCCSASLACFASSFSRSFACLASSFSRSLACAASSFTRFASSRRRCFSASTAIRTLSFSCFFCCFASSFRICFASVTPFVVSKPWRLGGFGGATLPLSTAITLSKLGTPFSGAIAGAVTAAEDSSKGSACSARFTASRVERRRRKPSRALRSLLNGARHGSGSISESRTHHRQARSSDVSSSGFKVKSRAAPSGSRMSTRSAHAVSAVETADSTAASGMPLPTASRVTSHR
mmetsp:Transcript_26375/g.86540  ORF Transcript_26375/g.86540 Transcript_26375/m.86540 type:complete len:324 (-) Transcript_26375:1062-2033(-)